eukprot:6140684-Alexandrium_andersonii.AAC.1
MGVSDFRRFCAPERAKIGDPPALLCRAPEARRASHGASRAWICIMGVSECSASGTGRSTAEGPQRFQRFKH